MKPLSIGLLLSPLVIGAWLLVSPQKKEDGATPTVVQKVSLADLGYVPTKPRKPLIATPLDVYDTVDQPTPVIKTIKDFAGKPLILHFWATWCAPCVEEMPHFDQFAKEHGEDVHILAIVTEKSGVEPIRKFYKEKGIQNLKICFDDRGKFTLGMQVQSLPTTILVTDSGEEAGRLLGAVDWMGDAKSTLVSYFKKLKS